MSLNHFSIKTEPRGKQLLRNSSMITRYECKIRPSQGEDKKVGPTMCPDETSLWPFARESKIDGAATLTDLRLCQLGQPIQQDEDLWIPRLTGDDSRRRKYTATWLYYESMIPSCWFGQGAPTDQSS